MKHKSYDGLPLTSHKQANVRKYAFLSNLTVLKHENRAKHQYNERYFCVYLHSKALFCMQPYNYTTKVFESHQRKIKWQIWYLLDNPHHPVNYIFAQAPPRPAYEKNFF